MTGAPQGDGREAGALAAAARELAARYAGGGPGDTLVVTTRAGALVARRGDVVVKIHREGTDGATLARRLAIAADPAFADVLVPPLDAAPLRLPVGRGVHWASVWPATEVLDAGLGEAAVPWAAAGALLAGLHGRSVPDGAPLHGGRARLARAVARSQAAGRPELAVLGCALLAELDAAPPVGVRLAHGDWHLGQLGRLDGAGAGDDAPAAVPWRLLDVDDLGRGDPAWDLGRPAGFWAAGLLDDDSWATFLGAYRAAHGPGVPTDGDPWPRLDLAAQCAVLVAAATAAQDDDGTDGTDGTDGEDADDAVEALVAACRRISRRRERRG